MNQDIEKYLSENMSSTERKQFLQQLEQDTSLRDEVIKSKNLLALWGLAGQPDDDVHTRKALDGFGTMVRARRKRQRQITLLKYAAVVAVLIVATWMVAWHYASYPDVPQYTEINVPKGQCVNLTLADGSKVWLSPLSKMKIPSKFNQQQRTVELDGEGYFSVARDEARPFTVQTGRYNIQVLGTEFNVFAYSKLEHRFETCLVKGAVKVYNACNEGEAVFLQPNEKALLIGDRIVKQSSDFGSGEYAKKGVFSFRMKTFKEILDYLKLWYDVDFIVQEGVDLNRTISGKFRQNGEVSIVLDALREICDFSYQKKDDDNYIISK